MKSYMIRPIPKYILTKIKKLDLIECPSQKGAPRMYSYLTSIRKELVKITVAVKRGVQRPVNRTTKAVSRKKCIYRWCCKQVAAHGVRSDKCFVKDMEYSYMGGYRIGWHAEGLTAYKKWFEGGGWGYADCKYFNPYATLVNPEYVSRFNEYKYSGYAKSILFTSALLTQIKKASWQDRK